MYECIAGPVRRLASLSAVALFVLAQVGCGGNTISSAGNGTTTGTTVTPPAVVIPAIASVSPSILVAGAGPTTLTVAGTGFIATTVVQVNAVSLATTYVSPTQVTAVLPSAQLVSGGMLNIVAVNGSVASPIAAAATIQVNNPVPAIAAFAPAIYTVGSGAATLTINGQGFVSGTVAQVNGSTRATNFVSGTQLTVAMTAADLAVAGGLSLVVANAAPGGGVSAAAVLPAAAPTVGAISPAVLAAGAGTTAVAVSGTGFTPGTTMQVGGVFEPTSYVSSTQLTFTMPATQLASGGVLPAVAVNTSGSSASGTPVTLEIDNPAPKITAFVPSSLNAGSLASSVAVAGTGFVPGTTIQANGSPRSTQFVTSTQVAVILTAADLASGGSVSLMAVNAAPGGGSSAAASVAVNNPLPYAASLAPAVVVAGTTTPSTITVTGTNFVSGSTVQVRGSSRATTYVSPTQLTFQLTAADQVAIAYLSVTVVNATPGGGTSYTLTLLVAGPTPTPVITAVSPASFLVGSSDSQIQVSGTSLGSLGFSGYYVPAAYGTVLWNGTPLTTSYSSNNGYSVTSLYATVPASLLASVGTANITVSTLTATPGVSNALPVSITNPPPPTLTGTSPAFAPINTSTVVTLSGTGFTAASTVAFNGTNLPVTSGSLNSLTVTLPASSLPLPGNGSFTVTTPAPGGGTSAPLPFTAYAPIVNNSMLYNPVNGLLYLSVPSSAGAPYGNSVVAMDPATGALGTPIPVGSEPNRMALTSDGLFLWVGLDGASAVRKVDLTAGVAGLQFSLGGSSGSSNTPPTAAALAALPGATNSVFVAVNQYYYPSLAIYDGGVLRGTQLTGNYNYPLAIALQVDAFRNEIYAAASNNYTVYTYGAGGLTLKSSAANGTYAANYSDDLQAVNGSLYTDSGKVYDTEAGALLGTFYAAPTVVASGPITVDASLGKAFMLDNLTSNSYPYNYTQIQSFNTTNFTTGTGVIPVTVPTSYPYNNAYPSHLTRWGTNGLAFRNNLGVFSFRSNIVKDLSSTSADLSVAVTVSGSNATGANSTYVATVTNAGLAAATNVTLAALIPSTGSLVSVTPSVGSCSAASGVTCDLGGLANGATTTVTLVVTQTTAGTATLTALVTGSENDPNTANNQASASPAITGNAYALAPTLSAISPASIKSGALDTTITLTGTGFASGSTVQLAGTLLTSSYVSATQITATVPAASLASLGWAPVTVTTPAPGGGTTSPLPLTVYSVLTVGVNHMVYDPYTRKIMASVGSGSSTITGNSIAALTPETATFGTPVNIGSQPGALALTSDGQILYTALTGSQSVARFNMLNQTADFTVALPPAANVSFPGLRSIAVQPGTENTLAIDLGQYTGTGLYDFNPVSKTATIRGQATGYYGGSCLQFTDANSLFTLDPPGSSVLDHYPVTATGLGTRDTSSLNNLNCFKISAALLYGIGGVVANPSTSPVVEMGTFPLPAGTYNSNSTSSGNVAPDDSLRRTFFAVNTTATYCCGSQSFDSIEAFSNDTYLPAGLLPLGFGATEGSTVSFTVQDLVRWGQDGLAVLTSGGHIYLLRGPAVVPQALGQSTAAALTASSATTIAHGVGNTLLTLTGSNFLPGVAVTWNGSYRTTTVVDPKHVTVAIPAADLAAAGSASLVATNPGASASAALTVTIN